MSFPRPIPRKMFWSADVGGTSTCPECGASLEKESQVFLVLHEKPGIATEQFISTNDGYFCPVCPTVVLDRESIASPFQVLVGPHPGEITVRGIVDLEAIPEDKRDLPLGEPGNPIPLVRFTNLPSLVEEKRAQRRERKRKKGKKK